MTSAITLGHGRWDSGEEEQRRQPGESISPLKAKVTDHTLTEVAFDVMENWSTSISYLAGP